MAPEDEAIERRTDSTVGSLQQGETKGLGSMAGTVEVPRNPTFGGDHEESGSVGVFAVRLLAELESDGVRERLRIFLGSDQEVPALAAVAAVVHEHVRGPLGGGKLVALVGMRCSPRGRRIDLQWSNPCPGGSRSSRSARDCRAEGTSGTPSGAGPGVRR